MHGILLDWLVQVHARFQLLPETLFLCVDIMDRFLSAQVASLAKLQLVGITCLFISSKVEEIVTPSISHFLHCMDSSYTESEILLGVLCPENDRLELELSESDAFFNAINAVRCICHWIMCS